MPTDYDKYRAEKLRERGLSETQPPADPPASDDADQPAATVPIDKQLEPAATEAPATRSTRPRSSAAAATIADFTGPLVPAQFKLPQDLVQSLKLHSISENRSMSEIVLECLTSERCINKAWVAVRRAA